ncbi:GD19527 [Drosophila simulans]|uniref:GD19527 n=1 Tax=Drosophila simulans TaxID=7240 RepID=B4QYW4_DROSI|nr:GD19527 [Drosophila simulans]
MADTQRFNPSVSALQLLTKDNKKTYGLGNHHIPHQHPVVDYEHPDPSKNLKLGLHQG